MKTRSLFHWIAKVFAALLITTVAWSWQSHEATPGSTHPAVDAVPSADEPVKLVLHGREVATFRADLLGLNPERRAKQAKLRFETLVSEDTLGPVAWHAIPQGLVITVAGQVLTIITAEDADPIGEKSLEADAAKAVAALEDALREESTDRSLKSLIWSTVRAALATVLLAFLMWAVRRTGKWVGRKVERIARAGAARLSGKDAEVHERQMVRLANMAVGAITWVVGLLVFASWITFVLTQFPITRTYGENVAVELRAGTASLLSAAGDALPGLFLVLVIVLVTRFLAQLVRIYFGSIARGRVEAMWIAPDMAPPTQRMVVFFLWVFAVVIAYPYLPGSRSEAFKAIGVFAGLVVSLGSSAVVGQVASGMLLMYSRAIRIGDYIHIGDTEGTIVNIGFVATRIRNVKNEDVTIPNAVMISTATKNFTRPGGADHVYLYASVTIGYSTPWRQVHEMLLMATRRTSGLAQHPEPFVLQNALSDFYVEYQVNAVVEDPRRRVWVLSDLHANIQDAFNEFGVQILSPHYIGDKREPVLVRPADWYRPPARPPEKKS